MNHKTNDSSEHNIGAIEREKLAIEREKLDLERQKLALERRKARWAAIAVGIPLLVAAVALVSTMISQRLQASTQFQLKAAELVINTDDPLVAKSRAAVLQLIFPRQLPTDFAKAFQPEDYFGTALNDRIKIAAFIAEHPSQRPEILRTFLKAYENDPWLRQWLSEP